MTPEHLAHRARAFDYLFDAVVVTDMNGVITDWNQGAERLYGYTRDEMIGRPVSVLHDPGDVDKITAEVFASIAEKGFWTAEIKRRTRDGAVAWIDSLVIPVSLPDGSPLGALGINRDITARKRAELALVDAKNAAERSNQVKSEILANTSHELRTPLHALIALTELLLDTELSKAQRTMVHTIAESGDVLLTLINDLLDLSSLEGGRAALQPAEVELEPLFARALAVLAPRAEATGVELLWTIEPDVPAWVIVDGQRLAQLVLNLGGNALKFTDRGHVAIRLCCASPAKSRAPTLGEPVRLRVRIEDTGIGIPPEHQSAIFDAFRRVDTSTRRRVGGTGLGLAICRLLVERMGGSISVESDGVPGGGSTFTFEVDALGSHRAGAAIAPTLGGMRVGVLASQPALREALVTTLSTLAATPVVLSVAEPLAADLDAILVDEGDRAALPTLSTAVPIVELQSLRRIFESINATRSVAKPVGPAALRDALSSIREPRPTAEPSSSGDRPEKIAALRILVAEDNPVSRFVIARQLEQLGLRCDFAEDGSEALRLLRQSDYDLCLLDVNMPALDGLAVARAVRRQERADRHVALVAMTASALPGDRERCLAAGMDEYLCKPVRLATLAAVIRRVTRAPTAALLEPQPTESALNPEALVTLRNELGSEASFGEVLRIFLESAQQLIEAMDDDGSPSGRRAARRAAHTLKGSSAHCGAVALARLAAECESHLAQDGPAHDLPLRAARAALVDYRAALARWRATSHPATSS